jgi:hypothetical protein
MAKIQSPSWLIIVLGVGVIVIGYLIVFRGWTTLIAGVAPFDPEPPPVYVNTFGSILFVAGGYVIILEVVQTVDVLALIPGWLHILALPITVYTVAPKLAPHLQP